MRFLCFLFLVAFAGATGLLAYENQREITLTFFNVTFTTSVPILVGVTWVVGMVSGWTVVGIVRRSLERVIREPLPGEYARTR